MTTWVKMLGLTVLGTVNHSQGMVGTLPQIQVPRCQPNLQSGLSKDSNLSPAMLASLPHSGSGQVLQWGEGTHGGPKWGVIDQVG